MNQEDKKSSAETEVAEGQAEKEADTSQTPAEEISEDQQENVAKRTKSLAEKEPAVSHGPTVRMMRISDIRVGERFRQANPANVKNLAQSIAERGMINSITVNQEGWLISGLNRLEACKKLGMDEVEVSVKSVAGSDVKVMEIDENLLRQDLTVLQKAEAILYKKNEYEKEHPEIRHGGVRRGKAAESSGQIGDSKKRFTLYFAGESGDSESTIRRDLHIATDIIPEVKVLIGNTWVEDNKGALLLLANSNPENQKHIAQKLVKVKADSAREVLQKLAATGPKTKPAKVATQKKTVSAVKETSSISVPVLKGQADRPPTANQPAPEAEKSAPVNPEAATQKEEQLENKPSEEPGAPPGPLAADQAAEESVTDTGQTSQVGLDQGKREWLQVIEDAMEHDPDWKYIVLAQKTDKSDFQEGATLRAHMQMDSGKEDILFVCEEPFDEIAVFVSEEVISG